MAAAAVLFALVLRPLVTPLLLAAVSASVLWPVQVWLNKRFRGRRAIGAGLLTFGLLVLLLGPVTALLALVINDGADGVRFMLDALHSEEVARLMRHLPSSAQTVVMHGIERLPHDIDDIGRALGDTSATTASTVGKAVAATGTLAFRTALMLIALFFMLMHGDDMVRWIDGVSPLRKGQTLELLTTFRKVSYAVIASSGITAAVQAGTALVGYLIAHVPSPLFFTLLTFFFALIPAIGATVVCLFAALLLLVTGHPYYALFLALWGLGVVAIVDNLVKPLLIKRGLELHGAVVFFALIGGIAAFGAIGLVAGPLIVAAFLAVLRMYHRDYSPNDPHVPPVPGLPAKPRS
ncbi:MAG: AI-2E family transporter [Kofleriaceae bacterium]|nr:AI-2E family transporter [Kofleriaceae bacterium]